jgi:hypothetical protein
MRAGRRKVATSVISKSASSVLRVVIAITVIAYAIHTVSWIVHELQGGEWVRWLELTYLIALIAWLGGFAVVFIVRRRLRRSVPRATISDERTNLIFLRAHQVAVVTVMLAQIPFFYLAVPAQVLAQITVTTAVTALFASFAWLDR